MCTLTPLMNVNLKTGLTPQDLSANLSAATTSYGRFQNGWIKIGSGTGTPGQTQTSALLGNGDTFVRKDSGIAIPAVVTKSGQPSVSGTVISWSGLAFTLNVTSGTLSPNYNGGTLNVAGVSKAISMVGGTNVVIVTTAPTIPFVLHDDDDDSLLPRMPVISTEAQQIFGKAYVYPKSDGAGNSAYSSSDVPFVRNVSSANISSVFSSMNALQSTSNRSPDFWCGYAMYAFQFAVTPEQVGRVGTYNPPRGDSDPNSEAMIPGLNDPPYGAIFFIEQLNEYTVLSSEERLLVHEIAHQFGVDDSYGWGTGPTDCIMGAGMYSTGAKFYPDALDVIRGKITSPNQ